jgi:hypothetical protein
MISPHERAELSRDFVSRAPQHPIKLAEYPSTLLPDAARWRWCMIAVPDKACAAISNGVAWVRADGSIL